MNRHAPHRLQKGSQAIWQREDGQHYVVTVIQTGLGYYKTEVQIQRTGYDLVFEALKDKNDKEPDYRPVVNERRLRPVSRNDQKLKEIATFFSISASEAAADLCRTYGVPLSKDQITFISSAIAHAHFNKMLKEAAS